MIAFLESGGPCDVIVYHATQRTHPRFWHGRPSDALNMAARRATREIGPLMAYQALIRALDAVCEASGEASPLVQRLEYAHEFFGGEAGVCEVPHEPRVNRPEATEDFLLLARGLFELNEKGEVRTRKDAKDTIPGTDPTSWIHSELKQRRAFWWPNNVSDHARGGGLGTPTMGDTSCFKPGPTWNLTRQFEYEHRYGPTAADTARRRYGGGR